MSIVKEVQQKRTNTSAQIEENRLVSVGGAL